MSPSPSFSRNTDRFVLFFDYDGTLTDFKKDPNRSLLPTATRQLLQRMRRKHTIVLVTGRNLDRLYQISGLKNFPAVGTHGFECRHLPSGLWFASPTLQKKYRREAEALWASVHELTRSFAGVHIEKKPFSSTLHYRGANLSPKTEERLVREYIRRCRQVTTPGLWTLQRGKKMVEVMPKGFSKGKAVKKLMDHYRDFTPLYAGDDVADIPALKAVKKKGWAIAVGKRIPSRYRDMKFNSPVQLIAWLKKNF